FNEATRCVGNQDEYLLGLIWQYVLRRLPETLYLRTCALKFLLQSLYLRAKLCLQVRFIRFQKLYLRLRLRQFCRKNVALCNGFVALKLNEANLLTQNIGNLRVSDAFQNGGQPFNHKCAGPSPCSFAHCSTIAFAPIRPATSRIASLSRTIPSDSAMLSRVERAAVSSSRRTS